MQPNHMHIIIFNVSGNFLFPQLKTHSFTRTQGIVNPNAKSVQLSSSCCQANFAVNLTFRL